MKKCPQHPWNGDRNNPVSGLFAALLQAGKLRHVVISFFLPEYIKKNQFKNHQTPLFLATLPPHGLGRGTGEDSLGRVG